MTPLPPSSGDRRTRWFAVGALGIAGIAFLTIASGGIGKNLVYYWGPTQLHQAGTRAVGATVRLGGHVEPGSIKFDSNTSSLNFVVKEGEDRVNVHSVGVPPQMFRENIGVVVEGTLTPEGTFESNRLMVSHDNQYRAPKGMPPHPADLIKTAEGFSVVEKQ